MRVRVLPLEDEGVRFGETIGPPEDGRYPLVFDGDKDVSYVDVNRCTKAAWGDGLNEEDDLL